MSEHNITREQLLAELADLRRRADAIEALLQQDNSQEIDQPSQSTQLPEPIQPTASEEGLTKRDLIRTSWVAPLILTVSLPTSAFAQNSSTYPTSMSPVPVMIAPTSAP